MKRLVFAAGVALVAVAHTASAEPPPAIPAKPAAGVPARPPVRRRADHAKPRAVAAAAPTLPPADVKLAIEAPAQRGPWTLQMTNDGAAPVSVVADARLLTFEVTERSARKAQHCELPADMRPSDPLERSLILPPQRAYVETFEPRLYCFAGKALDALASGSIVVARMGHPGPPDANVAIVAPVDGVQPVVGGRRWLEAPPIALPDEPISPRSLPVDGQPGAADLALVGAPTVDAESAEMVEIPLTLTNGGSRPLHVRFRPEMLSFDVVGPSGVERCNWPMLAAAPIQEMFTLLPAKSGVAHLTVLLGAYCFGHVLDDAGLLAVWPRLDTRHGSAAGIGLRSFDGQVAGTSPTFVRLHRGRVSDSLVRPRLEDR